MKAPRYIDQQVSVIRKELVALTQDSQLAVVLNQLLYWAQRVKDFDLFLDEERTCPSEEYPSLNHGWIYKTADELIEETLLTISRPTMRKYLKTLADEGWIEEKRNSERKWDRTSHFRLNLKRIHDELLSLGYRLSGFEKDLFQQDPTNEVDGENNLTCNERNLSSKLENLTDQEKNLTPKLKNLTAYTYTENTHKNKNKEHTQKTRVREENSSDLAVAQEMVDLWERHILQKLNPSNWQGRIQLTEDRMSQLESLFAFHFQNDIRLWERFCLRVKSIPFLMGESPSGWHVTLDWILEKGNFIKVLEGNYDDPHRMEDEGSYENVTSASNSSRNTEKEAILASIKDPVWREWCARLSQGAPFTDLKMTQEPLSNPQLQQISNARFLECEDERLIWVGSSDQGVLNAIENLRLRINGVYTNEYPNARTIRTRLDSQHSPSLPQMTGENL